MTRKPYVVDLRFDTSGWGRTGTKVMWVLADAATREILEESDSFFELCVKAMAKYDESQVSFDKVSGRPELSGFVESMGISRPESAESYTERSETSLRLAVSRQN